MPAVYVIPSRSRPHNIGRLLRAWQDTCTAGTQLCLVTDDDDPSDWPVIPRSVGWHEVGPPRRIGPILNAIAPGLARSGEWEAVGFMGDDHLPRTEGWDEQLLAEIRAGNAVAYGNDLIQGPNLPTACLIDAAVIAGTGRMVPDGCRHLWLDNYWLAVGRALGISYRPDVIIEHLHPLGGTAPSDAGYERANSPEVGAADHAAFTAHMRDVFPADIARFRQTVPA